VPTFEIPKFEFGTTKIGTARPRNSASPDGSKPIAREPKCFVGGIRPRPNPTKPAPHHGYDSLGLSHEIFIAYQRNT